MAFSTLILFFNSCSKDSDLLIDGVLNDTKESEVLIETHVVTDRFEVPSNSTVVLDVLENDLFLNPENVIITETSTPKNGTVIINEDYTITYTSHSALDNESLESTETEEESNVQVEESITEEPVQEETAVEEETPVEESITEEPVQEETAIEEEAPVQEEAPIEEEAIVEQQPPVSEPEVSEPSESEEDTAPGESDSFTYTTQVQEEDGSTSTETGTVIINDNGEFTVTVDANSRFVATNGSSGNDGRSESRPWSLSYAVQNAQPGQTVFIKKGYYHESSILKFKNNGSSNNPIVFVGYNSSPGDIVSEPYSSFDYGDNLNSSNFPIVEGNYDRVFLLESNYVELHNIAVTGTNSSPGSRGHYAFDITGNHNTLNNCVFTDMGTPGNNVYNGFGVIIRGGDHNQIVNCYGEDVGAEAFSIWDGGTHNRIAYCDFRNDDYNLQTDYQFTTKQNSFNNLTADNTIENNRAYRYHTGYHRGHGLNNKGGSNNLWRNNFIYRLPMQVVFATSFDNTFKNNKVEGDESGHIKISSGAHHNTFDGNYVEVDYTGLVFISQYDDAVPDSSVGRVNNGHDNTIINNIFVGGARPLTVGTGSRSGSNCENNTIANNIFYGQRLPLHIEMNVSNMKLINNIFANNTNTVGTWLQHSGGSLDMTVANCNFYNNVHPTPSGSGFSNISTSNPRFANPNDGDFSLNSDSDLIDAGQSTSFSTSFNGKSRPSGNGFDIGAYEY